MENRIEKLKVFLAQTPNDDFLRHALAMEYIKVGNENEAKKFLESVIENNPAYVGSYYHLAKLLERSGQLGNAVQCYKNGMEAAKIANDKHAYNELRTALEEIEEGE